MLRLLTSTRSTALETGQVLCVYFLARPAFPHALLEYGAESCYCIQITVIPNVLTRHITRSSPVYVALVDLLPMHRLS